MRFINQSMIGKTGLAPGPGKNPPLVAETLPKTFVRQVFCRPADLIFQGIMQRACQLK
jgi:hypothetical protein